MQCHARCPVVAYQIEHGACFDQCNRSDQSLKVNPTQCPRHQFRQWLLRNRRLALRGFPHYVTDFVDLEALIASLKLRSTFKHRMTVIARLVCDYMYYCIPSFRSSRYSGIPPLSTRLNCFGCSGPPSFRGQVMEEAASALHLNLALKQNMREQKCGGPISHVSKSRSAHAAGNLRMVDEEIPPMQVAMVP